MVFNPYVSGMSDRVLVHGEDKTTDVLLFKDVKTYRGLQTIFNACKYIFEEVITAEEDEE